MIETSIITIIQSVGFPIFVATWLLVRTDKKEAATKDAIDKNTAVIERLSEVIKGCGVRKK
jgi:hypothetical protein